MPNLTRAEMTDTDVRECVHRHTTLLNPWEILRKYLCNDCSAVLTCACDHEFATYIVPHQAMFGRDVHTGEDIAITHPLTARICPECRGERPRAYSRAASWGATSKIRRYYWREIQRETDTAFLAWCRAQGLTLLDEDDRPLYFQYSRDHGEAYREIQRSVIEHIRAAHAQNPKYDLATPSDAEVIEEYGVTIEDIHACYVTHADRPVLVLPLGGTDPDQAVHVEEFVANWLKAQGKDAIFCESRPFHALYGSLMWLWVQCPDDTRLKPTAFGGRDGIGADERGLIWTMLPDDFGRQAHARRRAEALNAYLERLPDGTEKLLGTYDHWQEPSRPLRQYLWAHTEDDRQRGRHLVRILGAPHVKLIMRYLAEAYWERYLGWPDLLSWREASNGPRDIEFVEVKSSNDNLSDDQRAWIRGNHDHLRLPFRIMKVHRTQRLTIS